MSATAIRLAVALGLLAILSACSRISPYDLPFLTLSLLKYSTCVYTHISVLRVCPFPCILYTATLIVIRETLTLGDIPHIFVSYSHCAVHASQGISTSVFIKTLRTLSLHSNKPIDLLTNLLYALLLPFDLAILRLNPYIPFGVPADYRHSP